MKFLSYKSIILGNFLARQFTLIEIKSLFSIIFYWFKGDAQDRFHSHAFNSLSIRLWGDYDEIQLIDGKEELKKRSASGRFYYIPKTNIHKLTNSKGCLVLLISGPWEKTWSEWKNGIERRLTWGRKII